MATYYEKVAALAPKVWFKFNETTGIPANSGSATCTLTGGTGNIKGEVGVVDKSIKFPGAGSYNFSTLSNVMNDKYFTIELWHKEYANSGINDPSFFVITKSIATNYVSLRYSSDQSGQFFDGAIITRLANPSTNTRKYELVLSFYNSGVYDSSWFATGDCLKNVVQLSWAAIDNEPYN